jgi:hypothetical protein
VNARGGFAQRHRGISDEKAVEADSSALPAGLLDRPLDGRECEWYFDLKRASACF